VRAANQGDTVNLFFDRTDTWSYDSAQVQPDDCYGIEVLATDPAVNVNAYGDGAKPKFDGEVTDFNAVPNHASPAGPERWNTFFKFWRSDSSFQNIEITRIYGTGIWAIDGGTQNFYGAYLDINNFGYSGIRHTIVSYSVGMGTGSTVEYNTMHTGEQLKRYNKTTSWGGAIDLDDTYHPEVTNNLIQYNLVYDIYGEGINAFNATTQYNVVGDTYSVAIEPSLHDNVGGINIVRYNLITFSNWSTSPYDSGESVGLRVQDDEVPGVNTNAEFHMYGNIVINRQHGIRIFHDEGNTIPLLRLYNNIVIDSHSRNYMFGDAAMYDAAYIYNNVSIFYDQTGASHMTDEDASLPDGGWTISDNAFWDETSAIDCDVDLPVEFQTNCEDSNPLLPGEETYSLSWQGQSGATYFSDIKFTTHLYPPSNSPLVNAGIDPGGTFATNFLTTGTDFTGLPTGGTFTLLDQDASWEIGPFVFGSISSLQGVSISGGKFQ
jgi:hypothetical protein